MKYIITFLILIPFCAKTQNIDSPSSQLFSTIESEKLEVCLALSESFMRINADSMRYYAEKSLGSIDVQHSDSLKSKVYGQFLLSLLETGDHVAFKNAIEEYLPFIEKSENWSAKSSVYTSFGNYYLAIQRPEKAIEWYYKSFEIDEKVGNEIGKASSLGNIALIQKRIGEYEKAMENFMESLRIYEKLNDDQTALRVLVNISGFYLDENATIYNVDSAIFYGRASLTLSKKLKFPFGEAMAGINFSAATTWRNIDALANQDEVLEGLEAAIYSRNFFASTNFISQYHHSLNNEALSYAILGRSQEAEKIALSLVSSPYVSQYAHRILHKVYKETARYVKALEAHERFKFIDDSLKEINKRNQLAELQTKYESVTKDAEIVSLTHEAVVKELEIGQKNTFIAIVLISASFLLALLYLYFLHRGTKQKQKHFELEHRFLRSQLNPHFIFNALGAIQNFMFNNAIQDAGIYLAKFSKLMRQILENSREEFIPVGEEVRMLENYLAVHQLNTAKAFTFEIVLDERIDLESESIPPMFVQPFVENAIEHGISGNEKGHIEVSFVKQESSILIEIKDNGPGLSKEQNLKDHQSLATRIIQERIELFNQELKNKIRVNTKEILGEESKILGTHVKLTVPFKYSNFQ